MTSLSTRFLGQPRLMKPTLFMNSFCLPALPRLLIPGAVRREIFIEHIQSTTHALVLEQTPLLLN